MTHNNEESSQQQHDNKMAATAQNTSAVLLRRPLPPLQKKEVQIKPRKSQPGSLSKNIPTNSQLPPLHQRETSQRKTDRAAAEKETDKMKVITNNFSPFHISQASFIFAYMILEAFFATSINLFLNPWNFKWLFIYWMHYQSVQVSNANCEPLASNQLLKRGN